MPKFISDIINWFNGKKTYLVALVAAILGLISAHGIVIPEYVYAILGALGLASVRAAIK